MGAKEFANDVFSISAKEGFNYLVSEAIYEKGNDRYNGTISTCELGSCKLRFPKYLESNKKKAYDFIDKNNSAKHIANYIDLGVFHYQVVTVKKVTLKNPPSYKLSYVVKAGVLEPVIVKSFDNKTKADDYAVELQLKNPERTYRVTKEYVLVKGSSIVTEIKTETKVYKSKPNLKPMKNRVIQEVHKYIFYGWASC